MQDTVERNKVVYLTYAVWDEEGNLFERYDQPIGYVHGANGPLFEKIEQALEGHKAGDEVEVMLPPADGFGEHRPELAFTDDIDNVPPEYHRVGSEVTFETDNGKRMQFRVTHIEDGKLTIDANHPLAGQTARFLVTIVAVRPATRDEIASGVPAEDRGGPTRVH